MSEFIAKIPNQDIPKIAMNTDGMIVRLSLENRRAILGIDGAKYYVPSIAIRDGTKIIFVVAQKEAMPDREECLKIKKQGMLFGLPVTEKDIKALDSGESDFIAFDIVNTKRSNEIAFKIEIRRKEDLKNE